MRTNNPVPKTIIMKHVLVQHPLELGEKPVIPVMECPEYAVRVMLQVMKNGTWKQIWLCDDTPGWFTNWEDLRARMGLCYDIALSGH